MSKVKRIDRFIRCEKCNSVMFPKCLCVICNNYISPEPDEDGIICLGCKSPKVISEFGNFLRKYKCKYYRKITYDNFFQETKNILRELTRKTFFYRDRKCKSKTTLSTIKSYKWLLNRYISYRDYLFKKLEA